MSTRRELLLVLGASLLAVPFRSFAQKQEKVWRVGILAPSRRPEIYDALTLGLRDLGYVEGKNLVIEMRVAEGHYERLPDLAADLVKIPVDVIVTDATPGALAAQKATKTIPIVFQVGDAIGSGVVTSMARPGGNATGISVFTKETSVKQVEMLRSVVPTLSRVAVLRNPANPAHLRNLRVIQGAFTSTGVSIMGVEDGTPYAIQNGFLLMEKMRAGGFLFIPDPFFNQQLRQIADLATKYRLPSIGVTPLYASVGGLMSYGADPSANFRRLATTIDKIFRGANPGDLPVEQPTKLVLALNRKTAKALGIEFPPEILLLAEKVIE